MSDCIFCKLANGEIPTNVVYENDLVCAFRDTDPQAPTHVLVVPKKHVQDASHLTQEDGDLLKALLDAVQAVVKKEGLDQDGGYRLVVNTGEKGGQSVPHLHIHVLGGRDMKWPPG
jgi:histidine triad (HIT) family protein